MEVTECPERIVPIIVWIMGNSGSMLTKHRSNITLSVLGKDVRDIPKKLEEHLALKEEAGKVGVKYFDVTLSILTCRSTSMACRMLAVEDAPSQPVRRVYDAVIQGEERVEDAPNFRTVRTQLERRRASFAPPSQLWRMSSSQTSGRGHWEDGTTSSPVIHGLYHGRVIPFVMALMTSKTVGAYRQVLQHIKEKEREETGHDLSPEMIVSDFEVSIISSNETEFPDAISGCYFHFCQSLWRRIQQLSLTGPCRWDPGLKRCLRKVMGIGYLPVALVRFNFHEHIGRNSTQQLIGQYPALQEFFDYKETNYVAADDVTFPIPLWNVYNRDTDTRTNNLMSSASWGRVGRRRQIVPGGHLAAGTIGFRLSIPATTATDIINTAVTETGCLPTAGHVASCRDETSDGKTMDCMSRLITYPGVGKELDSLRDKAHSQVRNNVPRPATGPTPGGPSREALKRKKGNLLEQRRGQDRVIRRLALQEERCCPYPDPHTLLMDDKLHDRTPPTTPPHQWVGFSPLDGRLSSHFSSLPFSAPAPRRPLNLQTAVSRLQSEVAAIEEQIENRQCIRQQLPALDGEKHHPTIWQLFRE
ncbi:Hypp6779 [Branchiostoma lanceolatum]|uniref:Hypp6779 protein n=1 Tax=Branchiostoma lanceolatum TaxID=7740 RepID=A0A8J9YVI2_BRALA|nr:Hypp6779 [Branchiostoma lanceolatum]